MNVYRLISGLLPGVRFYMKGRAEVFLTFDDGPTEQATDILETLAKYDAKGTFFLSGAAAEKRMEFVEEARKAGHQIGAHGWEHLDYLRTGHRRFTEDMRRCAEMLGTRLIRPPYGKMPLRSYLELKKEYDIVLWDVSAGDYRLEKSAKRCAGDVLERVRGGSIILLHDNWKTVGKILEILEILLPELQARGIKMEALPAEMKG